MKPPAPKLRLTLSLGLSAALLLLACMAVATSIAPGAGVAVPLSDAMIFEKTLVVAPGKVGDASVTCADGQRIVGGGVGQTQPSSPTFGYIQQSGPLDETGSIANTQSGDVGRGWYASVFNNGGSGGREFRVFAICSARSDATIVSNPFTVGPRTVNGASIDCPNGTRAVGGGVGQPGPTSPLFGWGQSNGPVDATGTTANTDSGDVAAGWYASVFNFGATTRDFHVFALCSADSDAVIAATILAVTPGNVGDAVVPCPAGRRIVGGGVGQVAPTNTPRGYIQESGPVDATGRMLATESGAIGRSWLASVYNPPEVGAPTREFRVYAICAGDSAPKPTPPAATTPKAPTAPKALCGGNVATKAGTEGDDVLTGTAGRDVLAGLGGNDRITGLGGNDLICGGPGADKIVSGTGDDYVMGEDGNDRITTGPGRDNAFGGAGRDQIDGGADDDRIYGGDDGDSLKGGGGPDRLYGEAGDDRLYGGPGVDMLDGGPGQNLLRQ